MAVCAVLRGAGACRASVDQKPKVLTRPRVQQSAVKHAFLPTGAAYEDGAGERGIKQGYFPAQSDLIPTRWRAKSRPGRTACGQAATKTRNQSPRAALAVTVQDRSSTNCRLGNGRPNENKAKEWKRHGFYNY